MTSSYTLNKWLEEAVPDTKCICCKLEYYEFKYSCTRLSKGLTSERTLLDGLIKIGALQEGKTLLRQKREYCHYGGPPVDYSIVDASTLMEQKREIQENMSSDEARSSYSSRESSGEILTSHEESESSDTSREKRLQEIYEELAESAADYEKSPNKDFEKTLSVLDDDDSDTVSVNTEMVVEDLYEHFDSEMNCDDSFSQLDLRDLIVYDTDYAELMPGPSKMPEISSEEVSEELESLESSTTESNILEKDLEVSSSSSGSPSFKRFRMAFEARYGPGPGSNKAGCENGNEN